MDMERNFSCGLGVFTLGAECSGNGKCVFDSTLNRGVCQCNEGFNGIGDFKLTSSNTDCQMNLILIRVLWGINLFVNIVFYFPIVRNMLSLWQKHKKNALEARTRGKVYSIRENKGLFSNLPYVCLGWWAQTAMAIMKLVDPDQHIGVSWIATILWWIQRTSFYFAGDTFQPALLASLLKSQRNLDHLVARNFLAAKIHFFFAVAVQFMAIPPLVVQVNEFDPQVSFASVGLLLNIYAAAMFFLCMQARYLKKEVIRILDQSIALSKDEKTKKIRAKLSNVQDELVKHALLQFGLYLVFGVLVFTWRYHDYLIACSWIFVPITARGVTNSIVHDNDKSSENVSEPVRSKKDAAPGSDNQNSSFYDNKPMHIYGLELDPDTSNPSYAPSDEGPAVTTFEKDGGDEFEVVLEHNKVEHTVSPAMRMIKAFTPKRSPSYTPGGASGSKNKFVFDETEE